MILVNGQSVQLHVELVHRLVQEQKIQRQNLEVLLVMEIQLRLRIATHRIAQVHKICIFIIVMIVTII